MPADSFGRRTQIIEALRHEGRMSTRALSARFGVSEVTIRTDLALLEKQGWLERVHGGAEAAHPLQTERSFAERRQTHLREKQKIAEAAGRLVQPGQTILLDNSTSAHQLALWLREACGLRDLRVITNSFPTASLLAACRDFEIMIVGGVVRPETLSIVGPFAPPMLDQIRADLLFLGASGLTAARGLTDADIREVEVKRAMLARAEQVVALVDSSKLGRESFLTVAPLVDLDILVTDGRIPEELDVELKAYDVRIVQG
jgi:DeoR/GlpR family transcriptional regulator of sugar metabolism